MLISMTGYGESYADFGSYRWRCVVSSVNSRYFDLRIKTPQNSSSIESLIRNSLKKLSLRGKFDVSLSFQALEGRSAGDLIDNRWMSSFRDSVRDWAVHDCCDDRCKNLLDSIILFSALQRDAAYSVQDLPVSEAQFQSFVLDLVGNTIEKYLCSVQEEGEVIADFFLSSLEQLELAVSRIETFALSSKEVYYERLVSRVQKILEDLGQNLDSERLLQEVVFQVEKSDVTEELLRFSSHRKMFVKEIERSGDPRKGKKLDFILQEMNREINTIGSKANQYEISELVVEVKSLLEKVREQVQNVA
jgi:uncharacterized protein (TIGR00255 family)